MATAIYIGLLLNVKSEFPNNKETVNFYGGLFFSFAAYDILILIALLRIG